LVSKETAMKIVLFSDGSAPEFEPEGLSGQVFASPRHPRRRDGRGAGPHGGPPARRTLPPCEHDALFRDIAEPENAPAGAKVFLAHRQDDAQLVSFLINPWGSPTAMFQLRKGEVEGNEPGGAGAADPFGALRVCVRLWDLVRARDVQGLEQHIRWRTDPEGDLAVYCHDQPGARGTSPPVEIASARRTPHLLMQFNPRDPSGPASLYIERTVSERLQGVVESRMVRDERQGRPRLCHVPRTLPGAVWLQFAEAVSDDKDHKRCGECGKWFEVSLRAARTHRVYCSDACKLKAHRERKERAVRMKADGKSLGEIARELGSDVKTVRNWVSSKKSEK
jgi:hypothetical protein